MLPAVFHTRFQILVQPESNGDVQIFFVFLDSWWMEQPTGWDSLDVRIIDDAVAKDSVGFNDQWRDKDAVVYDAILADFDGRIHDRIGNDTSTDEISAGATMYNRFHSQNLE